MFKKVKTNKGVFKVIEGDHIGEIMAGGNHYEDEIINIIMNNVWKGVALDVGANIGTHTVPFAEFLEVHSFEPQTIPYNLLRENIKLNNRKAHLYNCAVGHKVGTTHMKDGCNKDNFGSVRVGTSGEEKKMITIDSLDLEPDLIKIDVEGAEGLVLFGAQETIDKHRPVIFFEYTNIEEFMEKNRVYRVEVASFEPIRFLLVDMKYSKIRRVSGNYIALP